MTDPEGVLDHIAMMHRSWREALAENVQLRAALAQATEQPESEDAVVLDEQGQG